ncbi:MAG TPA: class I SAM-dependent methyltransferase [Pseudomonadales bacterium]
MQVALCWCDPADTITSAAVALQLDLPSFNSADELPGTCTHVLWASTAGLALGPRGGRPATATRVDFLDAALQYRVRTSGKRQGLGKAVGLDKASGISVLDATAGLGRDAYVLAALGCHVSLMERAPLVHALLDDGLRRARRDGDASVQAVLDRMLLLHGDSRERFAAIARGDAPQPDVVYLDPMFPPRSKSASVKKDIALLHTLLGAEEDFTGLFVAALPCATHRVVVKRPGGKHDATLPQPAFTVPGKAAHFEVYVNSSFSSIRR